jgi:hypothetical protein
MKLNRRFASISLTLLPALVAMGCAGSEVIAPGNGQISMQLVLDPTVGPRVDSNPPFTYAKLEMAAVTFNFTDPSAAISLGPLPLEALEDRMQLDLTSDAALALGTVTISNGTYKLEKIFINKFMLNTSDAPPVSGVPKCSSGVLEYAEFLIAGSGDARAIVPSSQPNFEVFAGEPKTIRLLLDGEALTAVLESHVTCDPTTNAATVTYLSATELGSLFTIEVQ